MRLRRRELGDDVAGGDGVDDDEVVVALADLPEELADGEDLLHPGRGVGDEVEGAGQGPEAGDERDLELEPQVLLERLLGVHRHGEEVRRHLPGLEAGGRDLEEVGEVALGVDLADERALAVLRRRAGASAAATVVLPTPPLPVTNTQPAVEELDAGHAVIAGLSSSAEADAALVGAELPM